MPSNANDELLARCAAALARAREVLLAARTPTGHWEGELSSSALSTATAVCALALVEKFSADPKITFTPIIQRGLAWLATHANADGGWGDTVLSVSNISTTALVWAAFGAVPEADAHHRETVQRAVNWLARHSGSEVNSIESATPENPAQLDLDSLITAIIARYGKDKTFSIPILTMSALSGRFGTGRAAWARVPQLPFELAALPHSFFAALRLPVVSYALPALIAIGQARHFHRPTRNPLTRWLRNTAREKTLQVLTEIQPHGGGFLEATPLTSFVVMSLAASGQVQHSVVRHGIDFLLHSARADGSWPIDTNLATWVTTLAINAFGDSAKNVLTRPESDRVRDWLLAQQYRVVHPYTRAAPGGWAWTDLPGGVPDADDTAGALLALHHLGNADERSRDAARAGVTWLLDLQNNDGGIPTFCRGWTNLPFDRSSPDLTAHAVRAWAAWRDKLASHLSSRITIAMEKALRYLATMQQAKGEWLPLWFGNQHAPHDVNPTYGTAKVLVALSELDAEEFPATTALMIGGADWLAAAQLDDGAWGGGPDTPASVEETALAVEALAAVLAAVPNAPDAVRSPLTAAWQKGSHWLVARMADQTWTQPAPIGFYFAKLWYYERLYPQVFTVAALERATSVAAQSV